MIKRRTLLTLAGTTAIVTLTGAAKAQTSPADAPLAATKYGKVRGATSGGIHVFKGIPYGASTAGANRFRPPKPPAPWTDVRDALTFAPMAPQPIRDNLGGLFASWTFDKQISEDCLAINVWTPALRDGVKRPVMVWFHGGAYSSLSGSRNVFDGTRLCKKGDVVVVTLNHRLNAFGFLYLAEIAPEFADGSNAGMQDLVAALQWVRDNIAEFGGDPANVTIFGQSGGGGKVSTLMAMPAATGLFHRAIVQSGSYSRRAHLEAMKPAEASQNTRAVLSALEIGPAEVGKKLLELPMDALVAGLKKAPSLAWAPVADGRTLPSGPWWPDGPAISANIPLMIGTTETEMTLLIGGGDSTTFSLDDAGLRKRLGAFMSADDMESVIQTFKASRPNATPSELFFAISTAIPFRRGAWQQADRKAAQNAAPVYLYELDWHTPVDGGRWKSPHSLCLAMVFDNVAKSEAMVGNGPEAQKVADQMSAAWLAFARTGNPNARGVPDWPPYTTKDRATMVFDIESKVVNAFREDERKALAELKFTDRQP
jgi:para-nitrobenzyl esterase